MYALALLLHNYIHFHTFWCVSNLYSTITWAQLKYICCVNTTTSYTSVVAYFNVIHVLGLLLTNYRCHDSILRLPSNLFFQSTLQVRADCKLHPKTVSALEFVCTSIDSTITTSSQDYSEEEARATLEQVRIHNKKTRLYSAIETLSSMLSWCCGHASAATLQFLFINYQP